MINGAFVIFFRYSYFILISRTDLGLTELYSERFVCTLHSLRLFLHESTFKQVIISS